MAALKRKIGRYGPAMRSAFFPPLEEVEMNEIVVDTWLYGGLAQYGGSANQGSFANVQVRLPEQSTLNDLLATLKMPTEERGITFINGDLSAMPGMQPDLGHVLRDGDRVAFFHLKSMWPFQYRHGIAMIEEMSAAMQSRPDQGLRHTYSDKKE
jgi:sulfur carrier protein ThiS